MNEGYPLEFRLSLEVLYRNLAFNEIKEFFEPKPTLSLKPGPGSGVQIPGSSKRSGLIEFESVTLTTH